MKIAARFNMDFELQLQKTLFEINIASLLNQEFEYLYFFLASQPLFSCKIYSQKYQDFLASKFNIQIYQDSSPQSFHDWLAPTEDLSLLKQRNSKFYNWRLRRDLGILPEYSDLIMNTQQIKAEHQIYKQEFGFSGKGIHKKVKMFPCIAEPLHQRTIDFSFVNFHGELCCYQQIIDSNFRFIGMNISPSFLPSAQEKATVEKLILAYQLSDDDFYSFDCYRYLQDDEIKSCIGHELNYRKTMGYLISAIYRNFFNTFNYFAFRLVKQSISMEKEGSNFINIAPLGNYFFLYLIYDNDYKSFMASLQLLEHP